MDSISETLSRRGLIAGLAACAAAPAFADSATPPAPSLAPAAPAASPAPAPAAAPVLPTSPTPNGKPWDKVAFETAMAASGRPVSLTDDEFNAIQARKPAAM